MISYCSVAVLFSNIRIDDLNVHNAWERNILAYLYKTLKMQGYFASIILLLTVKTRDIYLHICKEGAFSYAATADW